MSNVLRISGDGSLGAAIRTAEMVYAARDGRRVHIHFRHGAPVTLNFDTDEVAAKVIVGIADGMEADR